LESVTIPHPMGPFGTSPPPVEPVAAVAPPPHCPPFPFGVAMIIEHFFQGHVSSEPPCFSWRRPTSGQHADSRWSGWSTLTSQRWRRLAITSAPTPSFCVDQGGTTLRVAPPPGPRSDFCFPSYCFCSLCGMVFPVTMSCAPFMPESALSRSLWNVSHFCFPFVPPSLIRGVFLTPPRRPRNLKPASVPQGSVPRGGLWSNLQRPR